MSNILYALPAFASQLTADDRNRMAGWVPYHKRLYDSVSHTHTDFDIEEIIDSVDCELFSQMTQPRHCLHHLLPSKTSAHCPYGLRNRQHYYKLPQVRYTQYKTVLLIDY